MDETVKILMFLVPALPLIAAVLVAVLGPRVLRGASHWPVLVALSGSCLGSLVLLWHAWQQPVGFERVESMWTWVLAQDAYQPGDTLAADPAVATPTRSLDLVVDVALRLDTLTCIMLAMVTFVSLLVAIYSVGYMRGDRGYWRFFAYIALFVFSMTMLVSVSNFLLLFVFWEAVGVCSYLLIGFWYDKPAAAAAGKKAFLVNRVGDFGFMLGVFLIWTTYGSLNYHDTPGAAPAIVAGEYSAGELPGARGIEPGVLGAQRVAAQAYVGGSTGLAICLLLLLGACGKSAQFPLHVWLPDAMEGPTPVSALIHAATMVTAGVYMIARCTPLFVAAPEAQLVVAVVGTFTALLAGLIALTQYDLKRVLAYSTVSQLGFMFLGLGAGTLAGISAGMFHLFTHAFFKAVLFLGAGSVMHAMGNVIDMRQFGGLRRVMPYTFATFLIGCLALAGVAPLAGFWSKDAILASVHGKAHVLEDELAARRAEAAARSAGVVPAAWRGESDAALADRGLLAGWTDGQLARGAELYRLLYYTAIFVAFLTSVYTFRMLYLTFYGPLRVPVEAGHPAHESPRVMIVPLVILAVGATLAGCVLDLSYLNGTHPFADLLARTPSLTGVVAGTERLGAFHLGTAVVSLAMALAGIAVASYVYLLASPGIARQEAVRDSYLYRLCYGKFFFDEIYQWLIVKPIEGLARLCAWVDDGLVDGLVNGVGRVPLALGTLLRSMQTGLMQFYALAMMLGALLLLLVIDPQWLGRALVWLGAIWSGGGQP